MWAYGLHIAQYTGYGLGAAQHPGYGALPY
jgi:hypothetical protein